MVADEKRQDFEVVADDLPVVVHQDGERGGGDGVGDFAGDVEPPGPVPDEKEKQRQARNQAQGNFNGRHHDLDSPCK